MVFMEIAAGNLAADAWVRLKGVSQFSPSLV